MCNDLNIGIRYNDSWSKINFVDPPCKLYNPYCHTLHHIPCASSLLGGWLNTLWSIHDSTGAVYFLSLDHLVFFHCTLYNHRTVKPKLWRPTHLLFFNDCTGMQFYCRARSLLEILFLIERSNFHRTHYENKLTKNIRPTEI